MPLENLSSASERDAFQRQRVLDQHLTDRLRVEIPEDRLQRETVLLAKRDHQAVICRRGLQLEIEGDAEAFAQGEAPGAVDPPAEGRVQNQLHPTAFVEEPFSHDRVLRRHGPQHGLAGEHVLDGLLRATLI